MGQRICSIPDCGKPTHSRGWCSTHYSRWCRHGDPSVANVRARKEESCSLLDCDKPVRYNGMCGTHAGNKRRYGHAVPVRDWPLIARLADVGWDVDDRGCWLWRGALNDSGYGILAAHRLGLRYARVHRLMWEMHDGPIPDGLMIRHRCDTPACVNPDHLEPGTQEDNMGDMVERGRSRAYSTGRYDGVCINGSHDTTQVGALRTVTKKGGASYQTCVGCDRERKRKHQAKKKAERAASGKTAA